MGDEDDYRSRLVGRELSLDKRHDLFAATPPKEAMQALISLCAKSQGGREPLRFATIDIKRAYVYAPATRKLLIKLPAEDCLPGEEEMVGELKLSLYGTSDAALNWAKQHTQHLSKIGFQRGRATACNFVHKSRNIRLTCHGDDFIIVALCKEIEWLVKEMEKEHELKYTIVGPEAGLSKEVRILNRRVRWTQDGIQYECDRRHADIVVGLLGMEEMKPLSSPALTEIIDCFKKEEEKKEGSAEVRQRALEHVSSDVDKPQVTEFRREKVKEHHDKLKNEVIAKSR